MILSVNAVPYGSTAKIMIGIAELCVSENIENITSTGYSYHPIKELPASNIRIGGLLDKSFHMFMNRISGYHGYFSWLATWRFLKKVTELNPDIIHLHNIHGWYLNFPMLFNYIKNHDIRVIWTLHDCWAFTGQCPHFTMAHCERWKSGCHHCMQLKSYPATWVDRSEVMWKKKRGWFTGIKDMTIVTPSQWLADLLGESFLKEYPVKVISNGIDMSVFNPTESDFRGRYAIGNKYLLLGVSFGWGKSKGLDIFIELSKRLDARTYQIVLVGTDDKVDRLLPNNIISIHRTQNQRELATIYTAADLFVNPTREEVLGLVNIESLACGTPVVTFRSGGSPECIDETCGSVVECDDIDALEKEIIRIHGEHPYETQACVNRAGKFDCKKTYLKYLALYKK